MKSKKLSIFKFANEFSLEQQDEAKKEATERGWGKCRAFTWGAFVGVMAFVIIILIQLAESAGDALIE